MQPTQSYNHTITFTHYIFPTNMETLALIPMLNLSSPNIFHKQNG